MKFKWYECKWCNWQGWTRMDEKTNARVWGGCGIDAPPEHQGGPHAWEMQGVWPRDEEPEDESYIGE